LELFPAIRYNLFYFEGKIEKDFHCYQGYDFAVKLDIPIPNKKLVADQKHYSFASSREKFISIFVSSKKLT
jgi:hypothetical protein